jgi:hypothetical protein
MTSKDPAPDPPPIPKRVAYNYTEAGALFGRSRGWITGLVKAGKLTPICELGAKMIPASEIARVAKLIDDGSTEPGSTSTP